jgi:hypothetical protein
MVVLLKSYISVALDGYLLSALHFYERHDFLLQ